MLYMGVQKYIVLMIMETHYVVKRYGWFQDTLKQQVLENELKKEGVNNEK